jgi:hypothetical protein
LLREIMAPARGIDERRSRRRYPIVVPMHYQLADDQGQAIAAETAGVLHNLATNGVGFLAAQPLKREAKLLIRWEIGNQQFRFLAEVARCRPLLSHYDIGARLVKRLSGHPPSQQPSEGSAVPVEAAYSGNRVVDK